MRTRVVGFLRASSYSSSSHKRATLYECLLRHESACTGVSLRDRKVHSFVAVLLFLQAHFDQVHATK